MGNLGQDPDLRHTQNQTAVCRLSVATTDYQIKDGEKTETTEWHSVVVWGKQAENCAKYLTKGKSVLVEGRIQTRSWEKDGVKKYKTEIVAQSVQFLTPRASNNEAPNMPQETGLDDIPF
jgi:single-strand DNA-binding protein